MLKSHTDRTVHPAGQRPQAAILLAALILIGHLLAGCSRLTYRGQDLHDVQLPRHFVIEGVPFFPQKKYQCGPAALAMAFGWSGLQVTPDSLTDEVFTPALKGSYQSALIGAARRHGRVPYPLSHRVDLLKEIAAGHPVIVLQNLGFSWYAIWHYALAIGFDLDNGTLILHSGTTPHKTTSLAVFESTWRRSGHWGIIVLPPGQLPVTLELAEIIPAVVGLEKAGQWQAANQGYSMILSRWPDSLIAHIGRGNTWYAMGNLKAAESALREASRQFPNAGAVFNNLAHVLFEQGDIKAAETAARRAVSLGGPLENVYLQTLKEIQAAVPVRKP